MKIVSLFLPLALAAGLTVGCATDYSWRPTVPAVARTVSVPTFRNESDLMELGAIMSRQVLREFQREGTFKIRPVDESAIEIQGIVKSVSGGASAYDRRSGLRFSGGEVTANVVVSVIDRRNSRVLVDNRVYTASVTIVANQDNTTAQRDASGRLADELSRQVVDDVLHLKY